LTLSHLACLYVRRCRDKYFNARTRLSVGNQARALPESRSVTETKFFFQCALQKLEAVHSDCV